MAVIHNTTMTPDKLELLRVWLPAQPWYLSSERGPELTKAGGFRLDDPAGEVGIDLRHREVPAGASDTVVGTSAVPRQALSSACQARKRLDR